MTDIAERLARAVLDRIESDRLLNRDNVADAIRKELAVKVVRFPNETGSLTAYKPVVPPSAITASEAASLEKWRDELGQLANRQPRKEYVGDPTRFTAIGGPYSGSHRTYEELTRDAFLGGHYEIDMGLKQAQWIARQPNEQRRPMFAVGSTIEHPIGFPLPQGWRLGAGSLSHYATPKPGNVFITRVE